MKWLFNRIIQWNGWMHLALILFFTYAIMRMNQRIAISSYLSFLSGIVLFSLPVLIFITLRGTNKLLSAYTQRLIWILLLIFYPIVLKLTGFGPQSLNINRIAYAGVSGTVYIYLAVGFIILEGLLYLESKAKFYSIARISFKKRVIGIALLVLGGLFSAMLVLISNGFQERLPGKSTFDATFMFISYCLQVMVLILSYYIYFSINYQILFKEFLLKRGFIHYLLGIILILFLVVPVHNYLISFLPAVTELGIHPLAFNPDILGEINFVPAITVLTFSFPFILIIEWIGKSKQIAEMKNEQTETELNLLKQQIHPHFFFNTLNNLYALSISDSTKTAENILNLSELMRYIIYRGKENLVTLNEEINYLEGYIELQKLRIRSEASITFEKEIRDGQVKVPPLLFIIIVENAFKHGIENSEAVSGMYLRIKQDNNRISLLCTNGIKEEATTVCPGIGLTNLQRRLNILFPNRHTLTFNKTRDEFQALLILLL